MESIRLGRHGATDEEVLAAAKAANCDEFVEKLPDGYKTPIGENGIFRRMADLQSANAAWSVCG